MKAHVFTLATVFLFSVACADSSKSALSPQSRATLKNIESGTGKVLGNAGEIITETRRGLDASWETKAEQRKRGRIKSTKKAPANVPITKDGDRVGGLRKLEQGTGKVLENAGSAIEASVDAVGNAWPTSESSAVKKQ